MIEPLTTAITIASLVDLGIRLRKVLLPTDLGRHEDDLHEIHREWIRDLDAKIEEAILLLCQRVDDLEEHIETLKDDLQFQRVWRNFSWEAAREAIDERREMLGYALAGTYDPRLSVAQKARVERTLRELDPVDVRVLYGIERAYIPGREGRARSTDKDELTELLFEQDSADVLIASGCIRTGLAGGGMGHNQYTEISVTNLGRQVIQVLQAYLLEKGAPFEIPGREPFPRRSEVEDTLKKLDGVPGFTRFIEWARKTRDASFVYYPKLGEDESEPSIFVVSKQQDAEEDETLSIFEILPEHSGLIEVEHRRDRKSVVLKAERPILRVIADEIDAMWV